MSKKVLNFAPVIFAEESKTYGLYQIPYRDEQQLRDLRAEHNETNSFFRFGNMIFHTPMVEQGGFREGEHKIFHVDRDIPQTKNLVRNVLFFDLVNRGLKMSKLESIKFLSIKDHHSIIRDYLPNDLKARIAYKLGFSLEVRTMMKSTGVVYGLLIDPFYAWDIQVNCDQLLASGLNLIGRQVVKLVGGGSGVLPLRKLLGEVVSVNSEVAIIKTEHGQLRMPLSELYLENSHINTKDTIITMAGKDIYQRIDSQLIATRGERKGAKQMLKHTASIHNLYQNEEVGNQNGFRMKLGKFVASGDFEWIETSIGAPTYYFATPDKKQIDNKRDSGIKRFGPFSKEIFSNNSGRIIVIYRAKNEGSITKFLAKLQNGLPYEGNGSYKPFENGFAAKYRLREVEFGLYPVLSTSIEEYRKAIDKAMSDSSDTSLAIIETAEEFKLLPADKNPYLYCKATLLTLGVPSQEFRFETMQLPDKQLAYVLNNASLAMYAKMGGTPWTIPSGASIHHELVFGLGSKVFKSGRFGPGRKIVGFTTVFSGDGTFLLGSRSDAVSFDDYFDALKRSLVSTIDRIKKKYCWESKEVVRIVFHLFKPFKNKEIQVLEAIVAELAKEYTLTFSYLTFSDSHPWIMVDTEQEGIYDWNSQMKLKGIWQPARDSNLKIDDFHYLLQLKGPQDVKTHAQGYARPLLVNLHPNSTFQDMEYLIRQTSRFATNSWRSFFPGSLPVTIDYANQIAELVELMSQSGHFNRALLNDRRLDHKVWFL